MNSKPDGQQSKYQLSKDTAGLHSTDLLPHNLSGQAQTREFLLKVVDILVDYINDVNDRDEKVLHFKHPEEMLRLLKLDIPNEGVPLQNLIDDCSLTLKHQVKTGKKNVSFLLLFLKSVSVFERVCFLT
ncbi:glutamate decarboxylase-like [Rhopalosiphum maidis]|uniref:glutamate decarboxylase-like n=1 Tax=Rhopalosiphum maidis TaxID=43146 RepID=UPI000EFE6DCD|nr:glutamate decarboxylase-like [Rhopalosiphum maidis]